MSARPDQQPAIVPAHVAIIMDGNGRWATKRGLFRTQGHRAGIEAVKRTVKVSAELGIRYLTLFGFSAENWRRPDEEIADLMGLLRLYLRSQIAELHQNGVKVQMLGERSRLPPDIVALIDHAEALTANNTSLVLSVALSYGGRQEIVRAARHLAAEVAAGRLAPEAIDEAAFTSALFTAGMPDPDLLIRTSGEQRISNFLLWQSAYTEMIFTDTLWPDFARSDLESAIREFSRRDRRFGATAGQR